MSEELDRRIRLALLADVADLTLNVDEAQVVERIRRRRVAGRLPAYAIAAAGGLLLVVGIALLLGVGRYPAGSLAWWSRGSAPSAMGVPIGGSLATVVRANLEAARRRMPGGLVEPGWLPAGFILTNAEYNSAATGGPLISVDLSYSRPGFAVIGQVHIWQTLARDLGRKDPVGIGTRVQIGSATWSLVENGATLALSRRMADGRTISLDGNLGLDAMKSIAAALVVGHP